MKNLIDEIIDFPANPFVVLADFLIVLLSLLVLVVLQQSVSSSRLMERMAVAELQNKLLTQVSSGDKDFATDQLLSKAYQRGDLKQTWVDGDLQRFWFDSKLLYKDSNSTMVTNDQGKRVLIGFGRILKQYQGNLNDPGSGLYKRIIVEGHAARTDGDDGRTWQISLDKARAAISILQSAAGVSPKLLEASGRGCWVLPDDNVGKGTLAERSRRLEIVIVYSGERALEYIRKNNSGKPLHSR